MATGDNGSPAEAERVLAADVLVVGGGPAAGWAAISAAEAGARVILADKGWHGTSGATAPSNTGTWCVAPGPDRPAAVEARFRRSGGIADRVWMLRTLEQSWRGLIQLAEWGYPFPRDENGDLYIANLRGPDYMRFLRRRVQAAGVTVLDHHPVLELWSNGDAVTGAGGLDRRSGAGWRAEAGAVVLATGGCAFLERTMGAAGLTGDGLLMAAEAGADLSGMEFTGKYTLAPRGSSVNKGLPFRWATFHRADGSPVLDGRGQPLVNGIGGGSERDLVAALLTGPVYARLSLADPALRDWLARGQPNVMQPYVRRGQNPFEDLFEVELKPEGTVRGIGGLRIATAECGTAVAGLYVAGDAASRENVAGALSGGGAINSSWAIASGAFAGRGAAAHALGRRPPSPFRAVSAPMGQAGLRPRQGSADLDPALLGDMVRAEVSPLAKNWLRRGDRMSDSLRKLDRIWTMIADHLDGEGAGRLRPREVAAVTAAARWSLTAALARTETRGMHRREDFPGTADGPALRWRLSGVDRIAARAEPAAPETALEEAS